MSLQEISDEILHLSVDQQLQLLELLTVSLREKWVTAPEAVPKTVPDAQPEPHYDDSPLLDLVGVGGSGLGDLASRHDDYLYDTRRDTPQTS